MTWCFAIALVLIFCIFLAIDYELYGNAVAAAIGAAAFALIGVGWYLGKHTT